MRTWETGWLFIVKTDEPDDDTWSAPTAGIDGFITVVEKELMVLDRKVGMDIFGNYDVCHGGGYVLRGATVVARARDLRLVI